MNRKVLLIVAVILVALIGVAIAVTTLSNILLYHTKVVPPAPMAQPILLTKIVDLSSPITIGVPQTISFSEQNLDVNYGYTCTTYFEISCDNAITPASVTGSITIHYTSESSKPDWTTPLVLTQSGDKLVGSMGPWTAKIGHDNNINVTFTFSTLGTYDAKVWVDGTANPYGT